MPKWTAVAATILAGAVMACNAEETDPEAALAARGAVIYDINCTACHAREPGQKGPVGPPIAGASLELLQHKVLRNEYPPGYVPKRDTRAMVPLAHLEKDLPALHAFLQASAPE